MEHRADNTLITYGSLMPGKSNADVVSNIPGIWIYGTIQGYLSNPDWEIEGGYPVLMLDAPQHYHTIPVAILLAQDMSPWWPIIDRFEGSGYERVSISYVAADGSVGTGWTYIGA